MKIKSILFLLLFSLLSILGRSQPERSSSFKNTVKIKITQNDYEPFKPFPVHSRNTIKSFKKAIPIPISKEGPFIAFSISWETKTAKNPIRSFLYDTPESFEFLRLNHHIEQPEDRFKSELAFIETSMDTLFLTGQVRGRQELDLKIHFFNPGFSDTPAPIENVFQNSKSTTCPCPQPEFLDRSNWCPAGNCPENPNPSNTVATHLIVHHSAGSNTSSDWPAVVRSIWDYHVNTLGWSDVGYNWLVDPEGNLYRGRGKDVLGAHFCSTNSATAGICLLGTYTNTSPEAATRQTLKEMLAWYCCADEIDPLATSLHSGSNLDIHHISGHQDGCATACPGATFYATVPELRQEVFDHIEMECVAGQPDPLVESIFTSPGTIYADEQVSLTTTIKNEGTIPVEGITIRRTINGSVFSIDNIPLLEVGASQEISSNYIFTVEGTANFCVAIDSLENELSTANNNSCLMVEVESAVDIKDIETIGLSVFPNPNTGSFFIKNQLKKTGTISLVNSLGQEVAILPLSGQTIQRFDLSHLSKGVFFLTVKINEQTYFKKIIVF